MATKASIVPLALGMKLMSFGFKVSRQFQKEIYNPDLDYRFNTTIQMSTVDGMSNIWITFKDGKMRTGMGKTSAPDLTILYRDKATMASIVKNTPDDSLDLLLSGGMSIIGNMVALAKFSYLTTIFPKKIHRPDSKAFPPKTSVIKEQAAVKRVETMILDRPVDAVKYLGDPCLGRLSIADFPRLSKMKDEFFSAKPEVCTERAMHLTEFFRAEGFERKPDGMTWDAAQRNGHALRHVLSTKAPRIFEDDLLPGSTTSKKLGVQLFPEFGATLLWPELHTVQSRGLNPYVIDATDAKLLNEYVFPFWIDRNIREYTRNKFKNPTCQRFDDNFVLYFMWKTQAISHTIPDWETLLSRGISGIIADIDVQSRNHQGNSASVAFYDGTRAALEGVLAYVEHLRQAIGKQANQMKESGISSPRLKELETIEKILTIVPAMPASTFQEAITSVWITWIALHSENMNAGLSLGRLDQVLYPYFENEMKHARTPEERDAVVHQTIELVGHFYLKCGDHLPLVPSVGNKLFGGSSSDQALTVGGITPEGKNAVNDLTYIFLKVTEMLAIRDPNVNARYHAGINSIEYLARLCEVNINTTSTPSIHNDVKMIEALVNRGFAIEDARNWAATGCVEPTSIGKHFGHTNSMLVNLVAPLEVLLNNGCHPLLHYDVDPGITKDFLDVNYRSFDDVMNGYKAQLAYLIAKSIEINNLYGLVHQEIKPTPLLSSLIQGPLERGRDVTLGTARYNTSGVALVAMVDVIDSLLAIKKVVFDWKKASLEQFKEILS
nr:pyruvate formate lyase family protein [Candidatus Sigynarchaeota archaeon]